jgi:hypothetical protein
MQLKSRSDVIAGYCTKNKKIGLSKTNPIEYRLPSSMNPFLIFLSIEMDNNIQFVLVFYI